MAVRIEEEARPSQLLPWSLWALSSVVMIEIGVLGRLAPHRVYHVQVDPDGLPGLTICALAAATHGWFIAGALAALSGLWMWLKGATRVGYPVIALQWLAFAAIGILFAIGIMIPFDFMCSHSEWFVP